MRNYDDMWEENFAIAKRYYEKHKHLYVPVDDSIHEGVNLRRWLSKQNKIKMKKVLSAKDKYKITKLDSIGMIWYTEDHRFKNDLWNKNFKLAKEYYNKYGDLLVPTNYKYKGVNLGNWISNQRRLINKENLSFIDRERMHLLDSIGMVWRTYESDIIPMDWMNKFNILNKWYEKYGNLDIPDKIYYNGTKMSLWLYNIKRTLKRDNTPRGKAKKELVKSIGIEI